MFAWEIALLSRLKHAWMHSSHPPHHSSPLPRTCLRPLPRRCCTSSPPWPFAPCPSPPSGPATSSRRACTWRQLRLPTRVAILHGSRPQICTGYTASASRLQQASARSAAAPVHWLRWTACPKRSPPSRGSLLTSSPCCSSASSQALQGRPAAAAAPPPAGSSSLVSSSAITATGGVAWGGASSQAGNASTTRGIPPE